MFEDGTHNTMFENDANGAPFDERAKEQNAIACMYYIIATVVPAWPFGPCCTGWLSFCDIMLCHSIYAFLVLWKARQWCWIWAGSQGTNASIPSKCSRIWHSWKRTCRLVGEPKAELIRRRPVEPLISISAKAIQKNYPGWARLATRKKFPEGVQKIIDTVAKHMEEALFSVWLRDCASFTL